MYISTSGWVLHTPNAVGNSHFPCFLCKKAEKSNKFAAKMFFKVFTKTMVDCFISNFIRFFLTFTGKNMILPRKNSFFHVFRVLPLRNPNAGGNIKQITLFYFQKACIRLCLVFCWGEVQLGGLKLGPTKVKARKSFIFAESSLRVWKYRTLFFFFFFFF